MSNRGFTLIELVIAVTVIIILAGSALAGVGPVMRSLRVGNTFNKMVFMVQQARSAAATSRGESDYYGVKFEINVMPSIIHRFEEKIGDLQPTPVEDFAILASANSKIFANNKQTGQPCGFNSATIKFEKKTAIPHFYCDGVEADNNSILMEFLLKEDLQANAKTKGFIIHKQAGIPQIQQY
ncbi:MAG: prepilin-type N-terminal cleavage/methylation domain-containing protein [Candidatus Gracilibacteria bacterium]